MPLGMEVGLSSGHITLDGDPAPPHGKGTAVPPHFSAHVYCGQRAGWIRIPLSTEVGFGPGHIVLGGDTVLPTERGIAAPPPTLWPMSIVAKWLPMSATAELLFTLSGKKVLLYTEV